MKKLLAVVLLATTILTGCATGPDPKALANADYGPPPPANHQAMIKDYFRTVLIDPTAPMYSFSAPVKGYMMEYRTYGYEFGWKVCGSVNSKNRLGGYTGGAPFVFLFHDGRIVNMDVGSGADSHSNELIQASCNSTD